MSGFEGLILVAVPMRFPRIGAFIWIGSGLLECFLEYRLVEESADKINLVIRVKGSMGPTIPCPNLGWI